MAPSASRRGGDDQGDNLADFFDFSKPWVRKERVTLGASRMVEVDPLSLPPPATSEEEEASETEAQWQRYQVSLMGPHPHPNFKYIVSLIRRLCCGN